MLDEMNIGKMLQNFPYTFVLCAVHSNTINKYIHVSKNITSFCADVDYLINE